MSPVAAGSCEHHPSEIAVPAHRLPRRLPRCLPHPHPALGPLLWTLVVVLLVGTTVALGADERQPISVSLDRPDPFEPAFGEVEIEAVVVADEPIERVVFYVDGIVVGQLEAPPWEWRTDLGDDVSEHRFEVIAHGVSGDRGRGGLTTPGLRVDEELAVQLQQLYVTASQGGQRVLDLTMEDFAIIDDRQRQEIVTFARGDIPFTAAVLVDASRSMSGDKLQSALRGAQAFFGGMQRLDEGKLLVFSDRILLASPFTTFAEVLTAGLGQVEAQGGTSLNDHLYLSLQQLEARQGRRVVILLSDGVDSHSVLSMANVLPSARRSQALIYWLRLPYRGGQAVADDELPALTTAWRNTASYRQEYELLRRTVAESGGRILTLGSLQEIGLAFGEILTELRQQYVLGYYPSARRGDGSWHRVQVRLRRTDVEVRSRDGYLDLP